MEPVQLPGAVVEALTAWLGAHDEAAPGVSEGLYLVGSAVLDDWTPRSDIDVVAVVADPSDPDLFDDLGAAQKLVRERVSIAVDGPYLGGGDLIAPPLAVQRPWVLDGEYRVDGESFETNPVVWFTLATRGIALRARPPNASACFVDVGRTATLGAREPAVLLARCRRAPRSPRSRPTTSTEYGGDVLEWVALGVARMLYTWETGDVTSKSAAGVWATGAGARLRRHASCCGGGESQPGAGNALAAARRSVVRRSGPRNRQHVTIGV